MGLDVKGYRQVSRLTPEEEHPFLLNEDAIYEDGSLTRVWINDSFPAHAAGLQHKGVYRYAESDGFRAGSYGGYNQWRNHLSLMANGVPDETVWSMGDPNSVPFGPLIHFSDCEGVINSEISARLHGDFVAFQEKASEYASSLGTVEGDYWLGKYNEWRDLFAMAADGGFVEFA